MGLLACECDRVTLNALSAQHHSKGQPQAFQHRALFDMEFQVSRGFLLFLLRFWKAVDFDSASAERVFETDAVFIRAAAIRFNRGCAGKSGGAQQAAPEASAFFISPIDEANGDGRLAVIFLSEAAQNFER